MDPRTIQIKIDADGRVAVEEMARVRSSIIGIGAESSNLSDSMSALGRSLPVTAFAALAAAAASVKLTSMINDATMLAARVETLGVVMSKVGNNAGYSAEEMSRYAQGVASMGITTEESRQTVIKFVQANLDLEQSAKLARVAQDAAVIGNTNSSEALEKLMHGITTLQPEVMRSVGIIVNLEQEYSKFAKASGRTVASITSQEKQQIALNAALEQGEKIAGSYEAAMDTVGKQMSSSKRYSDELRLSVGQIFTPALSMAVKEYNNLLKDVGKWFKDNPQTVKDWASTLVSVLIRVQAELLRLAMLTEKLGGTMTSAGMLLFGPGAALGNENSKKQFERLAAANIQFAERYEANNKRLEQLAMDEQKLLNKIQSGEVFKDGSIGKKGGSGQGQPPAAAAATAKSSGDGRDWSKQYQRDYEADLAAESQFQIMLAGMSADTTEKRLLQLDQEAEKFEQNWARRATTEEEYANRTLQIDAWYADAANQIYYDRRVQEEASRSQYEVARDLSMQAAIQAELDFNALKAAQYDDGLQQQLLAIEREREEKIRSWAMETTIYAEYEARKAQIDEYYTKQRIKIEKQSTSTRLQLTAQVFGSMATLSDAFYQLSGKKSKEALIAFRVMKSGETIITTADATMKAYDAGMSTGGPWAPVIAGIYAAAAAATGATQLAAIWSVGDDGSGGSIAVPGGGSTISAPGYAPSQSSGAALEPETPTAPSVTINIYGNVVDQDQFARELAPAIQKAINDGY